MKGPKEMKRAISKYREGYKRGHWDFLEVFKWERCKKWFKRDKKIKKDEWQ